MSVINQMLRDLDARQASEHDRAGLPQRLRSLPSLPLANLQPWQMLAGGMLLGGLAAGVVMWLASPDQPALPLAPPIVSIAPAPDPASPPVAAPTAPVSAAVDDNRSAEDALRPPIDLADMKLSMFLSLSNMPAVPTNKASVKPERIPEPETKVPKPEPKPEVKAEPKLEPKPETKAPVAKPAPDVVSAEAEGKIDKRGNVTLAQEMAESEYRKGMQAAGRGDNTSAQTIFLRALELSPGMAKARQALLSLLVGAKQWPEAQRVAQNGLALDPAQTGWAMILARLQLEQGDSASALETLGRHAPHAQADADYQGLFAYLLQKQQRPAEAADRFKAALALRPGEGRWWFGFGLSLENAGRAAEAKAAYAKAREVGNLSGDMAAVIEQKLR